MTDGLRVTCMACGQANRVPSARLGEAPKCAVCGAGLATGKVGELDARTHDKMVAGDGVPVLVDYWAPWCGPCRMMAPEFARAAQEAGPLARFAKINTEDNPAVAQRLGIRGIPLLILWHRGREIGRLPGLRPAAEIVRFVQENARP